MSGGAEFVHGHISGMKAVEETKHFLIGFQAYSTRENMPAAVSLANNPQLGHS